ncbi:MAG: hypothetical protein JWL66_2559 [Sphingomonadales bacterium]|nr:hypothetical protein [Sphingomonadales bacterium]
MATVVDIIKQRYAAEQAGQIVMATRADQVPATYEAMTCEWLSAIACRDVPGAEVTGFRFDVRDDGSSNRRRIFLDYNAAGRAAALPDKLFCKAAENLENRIVLGVSGTALAESNFYNLVRDRLDIPTPRARFAGFDPDNFAYLIVMDDMAEDVIFPDERVEMTWDMAVQQVTTLAGLHSRFYDSPELGTETLPFKRWPDWWNAMMTGAPRFGEFCDRAFGDAESVIPARLFKRRGEIWPATGASVARHSSLPQTLIHSDVHFKNWYILGDGRLGLNDWQLTTIGHWSRDFAFATTTSLTVENRRKWGDELLRVYLDQMAERGVPAVAFEDARRNVRQQLFSALAFWTITLRPADDMPAMQPEHTTYEFIKRLATGIDDLDALDSF